jgi:protein-cysteine N-palmitoyltransferase HHAT
MAILAFIKSIYSLDTLDTRFRTPSTVPYKTAVEARKGELSGLSGGRGHLSKGSQIQTQPSKWNTPEFYFYFLVIGMAVPSMFWTAYSVSRRM